MSETVTATAAPPPAARKPSGFALLTPERRAEIARLGGRAAVALGRNHRFTPEEARAAGRIGGKAKKTRKAQS